MKLDEIKDPRVRRRIEDALGAGSTKAGSSNPPPCGGGPGKFPGVADRSACPSSRPRLNKTELRWLAILENRGHKPIWQQAITLALDPPFRSYRPDLAYIRGTYLTLVEVKGPHRFREKGIAKAALAAKTYPQFRFELAEWTGNSWKESVL